MALYQCIIVNFDCQSMIWCFILFYSDLQRKVEEAPISGNLDSPEGGFDAIMQAIACKVSPQTPIN